MVSRTILCKKTQPVAQLFLIKCKLMDNEKRFTQNIPYTETISTKNLKSQQKKNINLKTIITS
jgi:hypothetical protein